MQAIKCGWFIASAYEIRQNYGFIWQEDTIIEILPNDKIDQKVSSGVISSENVLDRHEYIVFPGFVNAHMHQYGILSHGIPQAGKVIDFESFLSNYWWPYIENRIRKQDVLTTARSSMVEMIHSGITAFCDILEAPYTEKDTLIEQGKLIEHTGMRGIVSLESSERVSVQNGYNCLRQNEEAVKYFNRKGGLVKGAVCTHTTFTCSEEFIQKASDMAKENHALLQFHLSESKYEPEWLQQNIGKSPVLLYEKKGALSPLTIASQCVKIDREEILSLKHNQVNTVHMPISNCEVGGGIAPIPQMLEEGLCPALGTDGYVNDFFEVMRETFLIHKANLESTEVMPANKVFQMATEYGANAMGLTSCGVLQEGMKADFVTYIDRFPTPLTKDNLFDQLIVHGKSRYVTDVIVNGKELLKDGILQTLNENTVWQEMRACANEFWRMVK